MLTDRLFQFKKYRLFFHMGIEACSGKILHLKVWHTNRNPRLVFSYFKEDIEDNDSTLDALTDEMGSSKLRLFARYVSSVHSIGQGSRE